MMKINQKINTWLAFALIAVMAGAVAVFAWPIGEYKFKETRITSKNLGTIEERQKGCYDSGGTVETWSSLCKAIGDFDYSGCRNITGGACAPEYSHEAKVCRCGEGRCFNGHSCVKDEY